MDKEILLNGLIVRLKKSDNEAFKQVYTLFYNDVARYAHSFVRDRDAARDIAQDIFAKLWTNRENLDEAYSLKAFIFRMTHNHCLNVLRKSERMQLKDHTEESFEPKVIFVAENENPFVEKLKKLVSKLPERRREALELSRFDGLSHEEIADVMEISARTVNNHIVKALQFLRDEFAHAALGEKR